MVNDVYELISRCFAAGVAWLDHIFTLSGFRGIYIGVMSIVLLYRFLLSPIFGIGGSSDRSKKTSSKVSSKVSQGTSTGSDMPTYSNYF